MKSFINAIFIIYFSFFLISCSTYESSTVKTTDIYGTGVIHKPVGADLKVSETKITGEATGKRSITTLDIVKQNALEDAVKKSNSDVLVEPKFTTSMTRTKINVSVTGYPATYTNFQNLSIADTTLFKLSVLQKPEISEPSEWKEKQKEKKISKRRNSGGGFLGLLVIGGLIYWLATEEDSF